MSISLDRFVRTLNPSCVEVELFGPTLHIETIESAHGAATLQWRAYVNLTHVDSRVLDPDIRVGQIDFVMARCGATDLADELLSNSRGLRADSFAPLFDNNHIGAQVARQFPGEIEVVMLVLRVSIDPALRGHRLGIWALSETIETMIPTSNGLILMYPQLRVGADMASPLLQQGSVQLLTRYWTAAGLIPMRDNPQFLAQHANCPALSTAAQTHRARFYEHDYLMTVPVAPILQRSRRQ